MGIAAIAKGIFTIAEAVPYVFKLINKLSDMLLDKRIAEIDAQRVTQQNKRDAILKAISKAETNEELIALSATLHDVNNGSLRE